MVSLAEADQGERLFKLLEAIRIRDEAAGCGILAHDLRSQGVNVSEATVGRMLRQLELDGALRKVGRRGRTLTPKGEDLHRQLDVRMSFETSGRELNRLLRQADQRHIVDVIGVRRAVEGEAAALAATNATEEDIVHIRDAINISREHIHAGTYGAAEDNAFHNAVVEASHNRVLASVVRMIRESEGVSQVLMLIRYRVGRKSLSAHEAIAEAIALRDPDMARAAMLSHIEQVRREVLQVTQQDDGATVAT